MNLEGNWKQHTQFMNVKMMVIMKLNHIMSVSGRDS